MICGPMHPFGRDGLRQLLRERSGAIEHGLRLLHEDLDCSRGALPPVDGICRDAVGRAVLVLLAGDDDATLPARVLQARAFCARNGAALERAMPELGVGFATFRLLVVGQSLDADTLAMLASLRLPQLEVCEVEPFRLGGQERLAVRLMNGAVGADGGGEGGGAAPALDAGIEGELRDRWSELVDLIGRLDPTVRLVGDRFARRASLRGRNLCEFWCHDGRLVAVVPGHAPRTLLTAAELRGFSDVVLRRYLEIVEGGEADLPASAPKSAPQPASGRGVVGLRGVTLESLRHSLQGSRLTREEYSALGGSAAEGGEPASG